MASPLLRVPSGNTMTLSPRASSAPASFMAVTAWRGFLRSMNTQSNSFIQVRTSGIFNVSTFATSAWGLSRCTSVMGIS